MRIKKRLIETKYPLNNVTKSVEVHLFYPSLLLQTGFSSSQSLNPLCVIC